MSQKIFKILCGLGIFLSTSVGCNLAPFMIESEVETIRDMKFIDRYWDPELFESAVKMSLIQNEGYLEIDPDFEPLLRSTMINYVGYAMYWLDDNIKQLEDEGNYDEAERMNERKGLFLDRAVYHMFRMMRLRDKGFDKALSKGPEGFKLWVEEHFWTEKDAEVILDAGTVWVANMAGSADGLATAVDRPFAEILLKHSISINPELENARGLSVLGTVECSVPRGIGGTPQKGIEYLERALKITHRKDHTILLAMAEKCAVEIQDREMYVKYLMEIIESGDIEDNRLFNKLARHKAERLLRVIDDMIFDDL